MPGLYFEEFEVGKVYRHEVTRTMTLPDSIWYTCMCMETEPTYMDEVWAAQHARFKRVEINPLYVMSFVTALQVTELTLGTTLGNLYFADTKFPLPVFPGDTLRGQTTIIGKRESKTKPDRGVVECLHEGFNQHNQCVMSTKRAGMMLKRPR